MCPGMASTPTRPRCPSLSRSGTPLPQRASPPVQAKLAVASPAELVTCDQTIERSVGRLKQFRRVATRYDKRAVNYLAWITLAAAVIWL
jgi:hypothetical protein